MSTVAITQDVLRHCCYTALVADASSIMSTFVATLTSPASTRMLTVWDGQPLKTARSQVVCPSVACLNGGYGREYGPRAGETIGVVLEGRLWAADLSSGSTTAFPWASNATIFGDAMVNTLAPIFTAKGYPFRAVPIFMRLGRSGAHDGSGIPEDGVMFTVVRLTWHIPAFMDSDQTFLIDPA